MLLNCELTGCDQNQLDRFGVPQNSLRDHASIMGTRFAFNKRFIKVQEQEKQSWRTV